MRPASWFTRIALLVTGLVVVVGIYLAATLAQVWWAARSDDRSAADAIVVLGAAQYDGRPSSVLGARLDHAHELWAAGVAPVIVVTGGRQEGDRFTEATAAADYLGDRGVPDNALRREVQGRSSYESLAATARFLRAEGIDRVVLVSDPYHAARIDAIATELGLDAAVSPTPQSPNSGWAEWRQFLREAAGVAAGNVMGFRRLDAVTADL
jgi:uncharacterized SAM-binding protein YcdF (DUF218 family)